MISNQINKHLFEIIGCVNKVIRLIEERLCDTDLIIFRLGNLNLIKVSHCRKAVAQTAGMGTS